ncbi:MAG: hypothetical protein VX899_23590 [Myxococcota bacterium]|nr:hypothetical protein [Myxococcota bacterium]
MAVRRQVNFYWGAKLDALPAGLVLDQQSYTTGGVATLSSDGGERDP